jgi:DNA-binding transcriptional regulator YhcF (GntR family)
MAVSEGAKERCIDYRKQILADRMKAVVAEALGGGLGEAQLRALFEQVVAESSKR